MTFGLFALLSACSGREAAEAPPAPAANPWVAQIGSWYCGSEPLPAKDPAAAPGTRDFVVKLTPGDDAFSGLYAIQEGPRQYIGAFTRFAAAGERAATFHAENSMRQKGDAALAFSPDFQTLTVTWQVGTQAAKSTTTLTAAKDPGACAGGALLK